MNFSNVFLAWKNKKENGKKLWPTVGSLMYDFFVNDLRWIHQRIHWIFFGFVANFVVTVVATIIILHINHLNHLECMMLDQLVSKFGKSQITNVNLIFARYFTTYIIFRTQLYKYKSIHFVSFTWNEKCIFFLCNRQYFCLI